MTSDLDTGGESPIELRRRHTFRVRIWALLPLLFMAWNVIIIALRVRQLDEYQIKLFFPGLAVGFTVTIFAAITVGTLSSAGFTVPNDGWPVALVGLVAWACTNLVVRAPTA